MSAGPPIATRAVELAALPGESVPARGRIPRVAVTLLGLLVFGLVIAVGVVTDSYGPDSPAAYVVNNSAQLIAVVLATAASAVATTRHSGARRRAWALVTIACGSWTVGQLIWMYLVNRQGEAATEFSIADAFFLLFTGLMAVAVWPTDGAKSDRLRTLLDAGIIGTALFAISWATSISQVAASGTVDTELLGLMINLAYPCGDIVVLTMVLLSISRRVGQSSLTVVAVAMALIALADGFYAYLTSLGEYESGSLIGLGWIAGFGLIGCAAVASGRVSSAVVPEDLRMSRNASGRTRSASMLPYVPFGIALIVVSVHRYSNDVDVVTEAALVLTLIAVLVRQYLAISDNAVLTRHLESRERELERQAFQDQLTGLPNRALFTDRVQQALEKHRRDAWPLALVFVDLDDFKAVNDTLGHPVGDELVIRVGERLRGAIRASDTVARFGGDEFAVLIEADSEPMVVGNRLVEALRPTFSLGGEELSIGASVGVAAVTADHITPLLDELFSQADIAMYAAKRSGKGRVALYETSMVLPEVADLRYRPLLTDAIRSGQIDCVFQPIIDLSSGEVHSMEALARWRVDGELVAQDYFIELAGRLGLLEQLTDLMVDRACGQLADWSSRLDCESLQVGVNVPPGLMIDEEFPRRIAGALDRHGLGPDRLVLEITEDALLGGSAVARRVADRLRRSGVQLWLDDFGTGYSSLLSLRQITLQAVKIDIEFVRNIDTDPAAERFLRALLVLGRDLDLLVTAEGVESQAQARVLRALGCRLAQGFLYARPAPAAELEHLLPERPTVSA